MTRGTFRNKVRQRKMAGHYFWRRVSEKVDWWWNVSHGAAINHRTLLRSRSCKYVYMSAHTNTNKFSIYYSRPGWHSSSSGSSGSAFAWPYIGSSQRISMTQHWLGIVLRILATDIYMYTISYWYITQRRNGCWPTIAPIRPYNASPRTLLTRLLRHETNVCLANHHTRSWTMPMTMTISQKDDSSQLSILLR